MNGGSTPVLHVMLQINGLTIFRQDCHNTGLSQPTTTLVEWVWEKDQEYNVGVTNILLSLEITH